MNIITATDSYKFTHWKQYPPGTEKVYSYFEARHGDAVENGVIFFGLQYLLKKYLAGRVVAGYDIEQAEGLIANHLGEGRFNRAGWEHIVKDHNGRLPVSIRAVPEGSRHPYHTVLMTVENTCPKCFWLTNYLETLLVQVWYPSSVATLSNRLRRLINLYMRETSDDLGGAAFKLHDFGFRGVSSHESAGIGGAAHLVSFLGTDTVAALEVARDFYNDPCAGLSIPAAEHSTITSWGQARESDAYLNMLRQFPTGLVAVVSDSYDIFKACADIWGDKLKDEVLARAGTLVVRPDSGDPVETPVQVVKILAEKFGTMTNSRGYKVLNAKVRVIQGDGIGPLEVNAILDSLKEEGFAADNIAFGMGGALLQKLNRDTHSFAFKCSNITIDGVDHPVYKRPVTDGTKVSQAGRFPDLVEVFRDGEVLVDQTFSQIRERAGS